MGFVVRADALLRPLIPGYLRNRHEDVQRMADALQSGDFATLRKLGHNMRGSGHSYGFPPISDLGQQLEEAAAAGDGARIGALIESLRAFLETVELPAA